MEKESNRMLELLVTGQRSLSAYSSLLDFPGVPKGRCGTVLIQEGKGRAAKK